MTHYQFLSEIYTLDFLFYTGCAGRDDVETDFVECTIMGTISYTHDEIIDIITNYWTVRRNYELQFSSTDLVMPDYIQDTLTHSQQQINYLNNFLLPPEKRIDG